MLQRFGLVGMMTIICGLVAILKVVDTKPPAPELNESIPGERNFDEIDPKRYTNIEADAHGNDRGSHYPQGASHTSETPPHMKSIIRAQEQAYAP